MSGIWRQKYKRMPENITHARMVDHLFDTAKAILNVSAVELRLLNAYKSHFSEYEKMLLEGAAIDLKEAYDKIYVILKSHI